MRGICCDAMLAPAGATRPCLLRASDGSAGHQDNTPDDTPVALWRNVAQLGIDSAGVQVSVDLLSAVVVLLSAWLSSLTLACNFRCPRADAAC